MKPFKIKLKDHHADKDYILSKITQEQIFEYYLNIPVKDERFACVKTIVEHYEISMKDAKIIMDDHWHLKEDFAAKLEEHLNTHYKKKVANTATLHSFDDMCTNMQYYMEYCQSKGYVTPMEWIANHKHY